MGLKLSDLLQTYYRGGRWESSDIPTSYNAGLVLFMGLKLSDLLQTYYRGGR